MPNLDQAEFWTRSAGPAWVTYQDQMDTLLAPVLDLLIDRAQLTSGMRVLDIGCGTGASLAQLAQAVGSAGHVTGLDISETMLHQAHDRLGFIPHVQLALADAQTHIFEQPFDIIFSRFGMMFFDDNAAAFANLRTALAAGGRMIFAAWGPPRDNPWFVEAAAAAAEVLGPVPKVDRSLPGPFAFEDADRVLKIMQAAGLQDVGAEALPLCLTPHGTLQDTAELCCHIGPADHALQYHEADAERHKEVRAALVDQFAKYDGPNGMRVPAMINLFTAAAPS